MSGSTSIEWTDRTWNPVRGCSRVSEGCRNCYAEKVAARFSGAGLAYEGLTTAGKWNGRIYLVDAALTLPLRWRKPSRIFVNSMSDLFHDNVPDEWIDHIFAVMALAPRHTFQVLTKRPKRMLRYLTTPRECVGYAGDPVVGAQMHVAWRAGRLVEDGDCAADSVSTGSWPLPNVWLGVSVEDQATADTRIPLLLQTPAAKRFVSYEPALGPVDFGLLQNPVGQRMLRWHRPVRDSLHWIIVGGESGRGARPFDVAWARSTVEQCRAAGVACFVKQLGSRPYDLAASRYRDDSVINHGTAEAAWMETLRMTVRDHKGGDMAEWPEDLRVREFPR